MGKSKLVKASGRTGVEYKKYFVNKKYLRGRGKGDITISGGVTSQDGEKAKR